MVYTLKHKKRRGGCLRKLLSWTFALLLLFGCFRFAEKRLFPTPYKETVLAAAEKNNISPALLYAIIKAESNFNPSATSAKGAKGLMQLMDDTAVWCSKKSGISFSDIHIPAENIALGAFYLGYLLSMYYENVTLAAAAYNAGQGRVSRWLSDPAYSSDGKTLSEIPFPETDRYVKKVALYQKIYERRLEKELTDSCSKR